MHDLFEKADSLNNPIECFVYDAAKEDFPVKSHWHYFTEIIYMLQGCAEISSNQHTYLVREGELVILPPSCVHSILAVEEQLPVYGVLKFDLIQFPSISSYAPSPANIFRYAQEQEMRFHFQKSFARQMDCKIIFDTCIREIRDYQYGYDVMLRSQIYQLIFKIIRAWIADGLNIDACSFHAEEDYSVNNITEYIDHHATEKLKVSDIAEVCHLSYSAFAVRFRDRYGVSCKEYIERIRIYKAEDHLLFTDEDINYIGQETGFSDCSHFIKCFKKYRGITPKQFRLRKRSQSKVQQV